jgi:4-diphosphocytidyl-2-C-methyl-D-erythritol kinase
LTIVHSGVLMESIELQAKAKINLSLDVIGKRPDGYHDVKMIMQTIGLHDDILLEKTGEGIRIECNSPWVPTDSGNIAWKAAQLILSRCGIKNGVNIRIYKRIPVAAGLAGGSTDAAAVFKGLNILYSLNISEEELMGMGREIGADVPYCIKGGTMLSEGIGEILSPLERLEEVPIILVKPRIGVSTAWVYKNLQLEKVLIRPDTELLVKAIKERRIDILAGNMRNVLESVTMEKHSVIRDIKEKLVRFGAAGSMMSGSGPTVFGIFADRKSAEHAYGKLNKERWECYLTETC